jgi:NADH dehydrogenase
VLAAGSRTVRPDVPGAANLFGIGSLTAAAQLDRHLHQLARQPSSPAAGTVVVIGAGFTGIELATALPARLRALAPGRRFRVVLVEAGPVIGPALGAGPRPVIEQALAEAGAWRRSAGPAWASPTARRSGRAPRSGRVA